MCIENNDYAEQFCMTYEECWDIFQELDHTNETEGGLSNHVQSLHYGLKFFLNIDGCRDKRDEERRNQSEF